MTRIGRLAASSATPVADSSAYCLLLIATLYQTRQAFCRTMGSPALQPKALAKSGEFETTPLVRNWPGECGLLNAIVRANSGRTFSHHTCAYPIQKRCSALKPSFGAGSCPFSAERSAIIARCEPPLSAAFSPRVRRPLSFTPSSGEDALYWSAMQLVRFSNSALSAGDHQFSRLPLGPKRAPESSKPCVSS